MLRTSFDLIVLIIHLFFQSVQGSSVVYVTVGFPYSVKVWEESWPKLICANVYWTFHAFSPAIENMLVLAIVNKLKSS